MRYEYCTRTVNADEIVDMMSYNFDKSYRNEGWTRVWSDIDTTGGFIVYRREIKVDTNSKK